MALINCPECGQQISDKAKMCIHCGCPIEEVLDSKTSSVENDSSSVELSIKKDEKISSPENDVVIDYLFYLKALECAIKSLKEKSDKLSDELKRIDLRESPKPPVKEELPSKPAVKERPKKSTYLISAIVCFLTVIGIPLGIIYLVGFFKYDKVTEDMLTEEKLNEKKLEAEAQFDREMKDYQSKRIAFLNKQESDKEECRKRFKENQSHIIEAEQNLRMLYNYNIIPTQYRNIYAVFYLYDYLSTSNESLTDALLHYNIQEMKDSLDRLISNTNTIIVQQAINEKHLRNIEASSALTAEYSRIIASCSEVAVWFATANFLLG